jgi:hypothetical protein
MIVHPRFIDIPKSWNILRSTIQPKENYGMSFGKTFDETYDYGTLFSGVLKIEDTLIITAPPFLNLSAFIKDNVIVTDGKEEINLTFYDLDRSGLAISKISKDATHIYLKYKNEDPLEIQIEESFIPKFSNKKVLFTMFKNDPKEWVLNWVQYHNEVYGINGFVLFSNNSDKYTCEEIESYLQSDNYELTIVDWPMKWGVVGPPWDSDFCKIVGLEYLKYKFVYESEFVLNLDVDEYFVSEYSIDEIIEGMVRQEKDSINMESKNISRYTIEKNPNLNDYYWYHDDDIDINKMIKWITLPKYSRKYPWTTHYIFSPNRDETEDFYYAHLAILTGEHHIKNSTEVARQRFIVRESGNKEDSVLKENFKKMKSTIKVS